MATKEIPKEINLNLKDYQSKADIKYSDFLKFKDLIPEENEDGTRDEIDTEFMTMRMLKIFYDIGPKDAKHLKQTQVTMLLNKVTNAINHPKSEFRRVISHKGINYGFIPNFADITVGELIDLDKAYEKENHFDITSILYRPIVGEVNKIGEYQIEEYKGTTGNFNDITVDIVEGYMSFFSKSFQLLKQPTESSTKAKKTWWKILKKKK